jgi:ferrochelatase
MKPSIQGILIINVGTPKSTSLIDVCIYLNQFLSDPRIMDINPILRFFLVKGMILPFRTFQSSKTYKSIWTKDGSPLMYHTIRQKELLAEAMGKGYQVELAMRLQEPSIEKALLKFKANNVNNIKVIPLFPQYASATTGSVLEEVMNVVKGWQTIPNIKYVDSFPTHPLMIEAFADIGTKLEPQNYEHILFSFHGLPERQLHKADNSGCHCLKTENCCSTISDVNKMCYKAQCHLTAKALAEKLKLKPSNYTICYQSRLGRSAWIQPYFSDVIKQLAQENKKNVLVFCPSFVSDCLETIFEIQTEYQELFREYGGENLTLVPSLNDNPLWIEALKDIAINH